MRSNPDWKWHDETTANNGINQRATLIVLDRRDDLATVLRHEFTYQALIHDTYEKDIKCGIGQTSFEYSSILSSGKETFIAPFKETSRFLYEEEPLI